VGARCDIWVTELGKESPADLALLNPAERRRRDDFVHAADRSRFTLGVALSRRAVAQTLGIDPLQVEIDRRCDRCGAQHGRPRLPGTELHLSVSRSAELVAVALTSAGPVGIDIERVTDEPPRTVAGMLLAPGEVAATPSEFFTLWCRKESVVKATGDGMRVALTSVAVTPADEPPRLLGYPSTARTGGAAFAAQLVDLPLRTGYAAALTVLTARRVEPNIHVV
jgi:4'-phosphopantetheinyl transferase